MKALITGGAGFIGSSIARALLAQGHEVRVLDNLETGSQENVPLGAEFIKGDIRDVPQLLWACLGVDVVFHQAAMVSVPLSLENPSRCFDINVQGTRNALFAAAQRGCRRVVIASSAAIYGNEPTLPKRESMIAACASPYAYSKWLNEQDAYYYSRFCSLETVCLRYFNVFGPGQRPDSPYSGVISTAMNKVLSQEPFTIFGSGEQSRDFVFVDDVAGAAIAGACKSGLQHGVFNVGRGESSSLLQLLKTIGNLVGVEPRINFVEPRPGDVLHSVADVSRLHECLAFAPSTTIQDGLAQTLAWLQVNR